MRKVVSVINCGRLGFQKAYDIQKYYANQHLQLIHAQDKSSKGETPGQDVLLIVEHDPVYTVGVRRKDYTKEIQEKLRKTGAEYFETNRGGLITFHGPGQMVVYPIINLKNFNLGMRKYVSHIEQTIINLCDRYKIKAETSPHTGVWVNDKKICAIGVHGSRYITTHGLALNCDMDLGWFDHIVPCGIEGKGVTSMARELGETLTISQAVQPFLDSFSVVFDCDITHESFLFTD